MEDSGLTIARLARDAGVGVETVRFYERRGLIAQPARQGGGYRRYGPDHVRRIQFVRRAQELGFTLDEIASLLELEDGTNRAQVRRIAAARLTQIRERVADLRRMERALSHLLEHCETERAPRCPIIDAMTRPSAR
jgi:MerR family mercuric resistance operon transcriptional regulator